MNFSLAFLGFQKAGDMYTEFWEEKKRTVPVLGDLSSFNKAIVYSLPTSVISFLQLVECFDIFFYFDF